MNAPWSVSVSVSVSVRVRVGMSCPVTPTAHCAAARHTPAHTKAAHHSRLCRCNSGGMTEATIAEVHTANVAQRKASATCIHFMPHQSLIMHRRPPAKASVAPPHDGCCRKRRLGTTS